MTPEEIKIDELEEALAAMTELYRRAFDHGQHLDARIADLHARSDSDAAEMERLRGVCHEYAEYQEKLLAENAALRTQLTKKKIQVLSVPLLPESEIERRYKIMTEDSRSKGVTIEEKKP